MVNDNLGTIHEIVINGNAVDFTITEFPYMESFDGETFPPLGWSSLDDEYPWEGVTYGENPHVILWRGHVKIQLLEL